jgi:predicted RNase H-like HicB family nuclease
MNSTNSNTNSITVTPIDRTQDSLCKFTYGGDLFIHNTSQRFSCVAVPQPSTTVEPPPKTKEVSYDQISTFSSEPYSLKSPIKIKIVGNDAEYTASFQESNIYASGDTPYEAIENLKSAILDIFEILSSEPEEKLGLKAKHQLLLLQSFIEPKQC